MQADSRDNHIYARLNSSEKSGPRSRRVTYARQNLLFMFCAAEARLVMDYEHPVMCWMGTDRPGEEELVWRMKMGAEFPAWGDERNIRSAASLLLSSELVHFSAIFLTTQICQAPCFEKHKSFILNKSNLPVITGAAKALRTFQEEKALESFNIDLRATDINPIA